MDIVVTEPSKQNKKFDALINGKKTIIFGDSNYSDYTKHKDPKRKATYIDRHKNNERWGKDGIVSAGFWARYLLWNKKMIKSSVDDINKRYKSLQVKIEKVIVFFI